MVLGKATTKTLLWAFYDEPLTNSGAIEFLDDGDDDDCDDGDDNDCDDDDDDDCDDDDDDDDCDDDILNPLEQQP